MPQHDPPLDQLTAYRPNPAQPDDLDAFWQLTLAEARASCRLTRRDRLETGLTLVDTWDVAFSGFAEQSIRAWLHPRRSERTPGGSAS